MERGRDASLDADWPEEDGYNGEEMDEPDNGEEERVDNQLSIPVAGEYHDMAMMKREVEEEEERMTTSTSREGYGEEEEEEEEEEGQSSAEAEDLEGVVRGEVEGPSWVNIQICEDGQCVLYYRCICKDCEWMCEGEEAMKIHLQTHAALQYSMGSAERTGFHFMPCPVPYCIRAFACLASLSSHMSMHAYHACLQKEGLLNVYSKREFAHLSTCGYNMKLSIAHTGEQLQCLWDDCTESFFDVMTYLDHCSLHVDYLMDDEEKECMWDGCGKRLPNKSSLRSHLRFHSGKKAAACPFCGEFFSCNAKLFKHLERRMEREEEEEGELMCKLCRKRFPNEGALELHCKRHVMKTKCGECGVLFSTKYDLNRHISSTHSGDQLKIACPQPNCSKAFATQAKLAQHLQVHTTNEIDCPQCERKFRWKRQLERHINAKHKEKEDAPKYSCHLCTMHYKDGSSLSRHLKNKHEVAIPKGFARFNYKKCSDGVYRLQTFKPVYSGV